MADKGYSIDIGPFPNGKVYGPYDVTNYLRWQSDLTTGIQAGSKIESVRYGNNVIFIETVSS